MIASSLVRFALLVWAGLSLGACFLSPNVDLPSAESDGDGDAGDGDGHIPDGDGDGDIDIPASGGSPGCGGVGGMGGVGSDPDDDCR